jgi:hypothetical protein
MTLKKLQWFFLIYFFSFLTNVAFCQSKTELNELGIDEINFDSSINHFENIEIEPFKKSGLYNKFDVFPNEKFFFVIDKPFLKISNKKIKVNAFIFSISKDSLINNIFILLSDSSILLKKFFILKKYKKGWNSSIESFDAMTWISPNNTCFMLSNGQENNPQPESTSDLRIFELSDSTAIQQYYILPKSK